ncbi:hypothetical protein KCU88_g149, partial [Aureobasidium melanogenum]
MSSQRGKCAASLIVYAVALELNKGVCPVDRRLSARRYHRCPRLSMRTTVFEPDLCFSITMKILQAPATTGETTDVGTGGSTADADALTEMMPDWFPLHQASSSARLL